MAVKKRQVKKAVKFAKKNPKIFVAIVIILVVAFVLYCYFNPDFYNRLFNQNITPPKDNEVTTVTRLNELEIHIIDVGQGDAILIKAPDGKNIMIDAADNGKETILKKYLESQNVSTIDYFIVTHTDADHIGSAEAVFETTNVKKVFRPYIKHVNKTSKVFTFNNEFNQGAIEHGTDTYGNFLKNIACEWEFFTSDSDFSNSAKYNDVEYKYIFDFLTPTTSLTEIKHKKVNNYSPIVMLEYCGFKMIFTGDAEEDVEEEFCSKYLNHKDYVDCDVLKVGHHGSNTSSTQDFLDLIKPEFSVISSNSNDSNKYNHPDKETLYKLKNTTLYRTDNNGNIVIKINGELLKNNGKTDDLNWIRFSLDNNNVSNNFLAPA